MDKLFSDFSNVFIETLKSDWLFFLWIFIASVCASAVTFCDKYKAASGSKRRISEKTLFSWAILGGSVSMYITMRAIAHKTKHKRFMIGLPVIIVLQVLLLYLCYRFLF